MTGEKKPEKYYVRFSKTSDFTKISEFYDLNAHKNVLKREVDLMKKMTEEGNVVLVEDEHGKIVAASITYPHRAKDEHGVEHIQWHEVGTTRIALNGYQGIFDAMIAMQTLRGFLVEPPDNMFVAQMETTPVQNLAKKLGWREIPGGASAEMLEAKSHTVTNGHATSNDWYCFGMEAMPVAAKWLENALENPVFAHKKGGADIELDFSRSTFVQMFKDEIKNLSKRDFGDVNKPDAKQSMHQRRDKWLKNFFR